MLILSGGTQLGVFFLLLVDLHRGGCVSNRANLFIQAIGIKVKFDLIDIYSNHFFKPNS